MEALRGAPPLTAHAARHIISLREQHEKSASAAVRRRCDRMIRTAASRGHDRVVFVLPAHLPGSPAYNVVATGDRLAEDLRMDGYVVVRPEPSVLGLYFGTAAQQQPQAPRLLPAAASLPLPPPAPGLPAQTPSSFRDLSALMESLGTPARRKGNSKKRSS